MLLILCFLIISTVYASAGFGGGSSYLAVLSLFSFSFIDLRMIALLCNISVVLTSSYLFYKNDLIPVRKVLPLILASVPLAYLGGKYKIDENIFLVILGLSLFGAAILMLLSKNDKKQSLPNYTNAIYGGGIGWLSGVVGIGGGVFLSPVLHLSKWEIPKKIAATTSVFILTNSIAGLIGQISTHGFQLDLKIIIPLIMSVFIGGQIGSRLSISRFDPKLVKRISAILILLVSMRILFKNLILSY